LVNETVTNYKLSKTNTSLLILDVRVLNMHVL